MDDALVQATLKLRERYGLRLDAPSKHRLARLTRGGLLVWKSAAEKPWGAEEAAVVERALERLEACLGGPAAARRALRGARLDRATGPLTGHWMGRVRLTDGVFRQSGARRAWGPAIAVAHELAHYWDWRASGPLRLVWNHAGRLSRAMRRAVGDEPGPTWYARAGGVLEDWAESVVCYAFPEYVELLREEGSAREMEGAGPGLGPLRRAYIDERIRLLREAPEDRS